MCVRDNGNERLKVVKNEMLHTKHSASGGEWREAKTLLAPATNVALSLVMLVDLSSM